jgi:tetratricopeptide (TPR) repeat protein
VSKSERVQEILFAVIELPVAQRAAYLTEACCGDSVLRVEVESLLREHEEAERFLAAPTAEIAPDSASTSGVAPGHSRRAIEGGEGPGSRIGQYKLLQQIGEGGFGSVFMAEQERPVTRKVAIKIIKLGMDTRQVVARFEQERQALALMEHPNIAKVLDAGSTETGRPFFVMELCKGDPIVEYCDKNNLSIDDRLELFAQVCNAVQHAHTKGIIHRDIKPSNILVSTQDGRPNAKVIDFGIAKATASKLTEKTLFTEHRQLIGTPEYMSPEQAEGSLDIDTRTDVYSLGVLLYELLTGTTPFSSKELRSAAYAEIQRIIREVEPPRPSTRLSSNTETIASVAAKRHTEPKRLGMVVRGELDWIVMKALEKDRQRRYETANGLGMDIRRYLSGEAVVAAPPGAGYRLRKFVRRNRAVVTGGVAVGAALLVGMAGFAWQADRASTQRDLAVAAQRAEAEQRAQADAQRDRAVAAEAQASKRAEELTQVAGFQARMLSGIDPSEAGQALFTDLRERYATALATDGASDDDRSARMAGFASELELVNATDAAVALIERAVLGPAGEAIEAEFKDQPLVDASLRHTLSQVYTSLGRSEQAATMVREAMEIRRRVLGEDHPDTLVAISDFGVVLENAGDLPGAESAYRQALDARRRILGNEDLATYISASNLGNFLRSTGSFAEAETLLREAMDGLRRLKGNDNRDTLIAINKFGYLLIEQGRPQEAEPLWREVYETGLRVFGPDDPDMLVWTHNLGGLLNVLGRSADAEPYYRAALEANRRVHGLEHPATLNSTVGYGRVLMDLGRVEEALPYYRSASEVYERTLGPDHPDSLQCNASLGMALQRSDHLDEAEATLRRTLDGRRRVLGPEHPSTLYSMGALGGVLADRAEYDEAVAIYHEALALAERVWGTDHPGRLVMLNNLGSILTRADRPTEAEAVLRESLEARLRTSGPDHPETLNSMINLARALEMQGLTAEAAELARGAVAGYRRVLGDEHPRTMIALMVMAGVLELDGSLGEAEALIREAMDGFIRVNGAESQTLAEARLRLGKLLARSGRHKEAEQELLASEIVLRNSGGVPNTKHPDCLEAIRALYASWDAADPSRGEPDADPNGRD